MNFDEYQSKTQETAIYPEQGKLGGLIYAALGLGEAGEIQNIIKKILRDDNGIVSKEIKEKIVYELGDLLYYCARMAKELNFNFDTIAQMNLNKLKSRYERGTISGSGDTR